MNRSLFQVLFVIGISAVATNVNAGQLTFTIDPAQSHFQVACYLGGPPSTGGQQFTSPQSPGSDTTSVSGTLVADVGANIAFPGGSALSPNLQPGNQLPDANGGDNTGPDPAMTGGAPALFGLVGVVPDFATGYFSLNNLNFDLTDISPGGSALTGGLFDATGLQLVLPENTDAYWVNAPSIGGIFHGSNTGHTTAYYQNGVDSAGNVTPLTGSVVTVGHLTTITIPFINDALTNLGGIPIDIIYTGQVVATATVPEPSSMILACLAAVAFSVPMIRRRRKGEELAVPTAKRA